MIIEIYLCPDFTLKLIAKDFHSHSFVFSFFSFTINENIPVY